MGLLKRTFGEFKEDNLSDWAAALTYYGVLSLFPTLIVFVSLLGLFGRHPETTRQILDIVDQVAPSSATGIIQDTIKSVTTSQGAGALLSFGLLGALWSASGYIGAFMRAADVVYEVDAERTWKKIPLRIVLTIVMVVLATIVSVAIVVSGPLAEALGNLLGLGSVAVTIWSIAKWPVLLVLVVTMVSILYYFAPNARQPRFRWITPGGALAVLIAIIASVGFGFYVANFSSYSATYGSIAGVIVFLLWLYIINNALLFGAELNAEIERRRELEQGLAAEEDLQLLPRDEKTRSKSREGMSE
jgi:membrane protein